MKVEFILDMTGSTQVAGRDTFCWLKLVDNAKISQNIVQWPI